MLPGMLATGMQRTAVAHGGEAPNRVAILRQRCEAGDMKACMELRRIEAKYSGAGGMGGGGSSGGGGGGGAPVEGAAERRRNRRATHLQKPG